MVGDQRHDLGENRHQSGLTDVTDRDGRANLEADTRVPLVDTTVGALLAQRAAAFPDREALVGVGNDGLPVRLSYRDLETQSRRVATALSLITEPGDFVALWASNVAEWPIVQYGAALADVVLVALNPRLRERELRYALTHCGARLLLHSAVPQDRSAIALAERMGSDIPALRRIPLSDRTTWCAEEIDDDLLRQRAPRDPTRPVMLQYTSGTTGSPKGVLLDHRAVVNVARLTMEAAGVGHAARFLNPLPMFHTAGCVVGTLGPLWSAGTVVLAEKFRAAEVLDTMIRERIEVLFYVPAILSALVTAQWAGGKPAPALRLSLGGASHVPPGLIEDAESTFGGTVLILFGQTELAPVLTLTRPDDLRMDRVTTVGRPLPQVDCKVVDDAGRIVPTGVVGEICARGYQRFQEYLHDPAATAAALDADGFVRTGDLGWIDERGYLTVTGRLKELIIRGGENISPVEIEGLLADDERVEQVAVVGLPDARFGEIVAAVVCGPHANQALCVELTDQLRERVAPHKVPVRWFHAEELPCTATGKLQRFALREAILRGEVTEL